ncbi:MAG: stress response translation initiation inhibitor YciH, partial [Polaromonas sp.]
MKRNSSAGGLVYSTDAGRMCPECRMPKADCICRQARPLPKTDGVVR